MEARLEAVQKFRFYIKNKIRRRVAQQFGSCLEAVRSCLEARLEAVQKFRFYTKDKIRRAARQQFGSLEAVRSCLEGLEAVQKFRFYVKNKNSAGSCSAVFWQLLRSSSDCLEARLEAVRKFRFYTKNKFRRGAARQYFGSCLEAVRSCLEARLEAVRKFRLYIKNKIRRECLEAWSCAAKVTWKRVGEFNFFKKNKLETLAKNTTF